MNFMADISTKHRKTLEEIFTEPTSKTLKWDRIERLLKALGAKISEGTGSRVRVRIGNSVAVFHRPHPSPDTKPAAVRAVRRFLEAAGVKS